MSVAQFSTLLAFIVINFLILFLVRNRTTTITSLIIAHLVAVLFFSISISNYNLFKEIVLALIIYSMVILFLISNYNPIYLGEDKSSKIKPPRIGKLALIFGFFSVAAIFVLLFFLTKNLSTISDSIRDKNFAKQNELALNPMILPSHPVHIAVKKFYLDKNFEDEWSDKTYIALEMNERKRARLKDKLSDNFLFKRSSDMILLIVAVSTGLLLLIPKKSS